jgi:hypothetical protein
MKRLFWDIETSPNICLNWRIGYKVSVTPESILKERKIICIGYKWEGGKAEILTWDKNQDDKSLLKKFTYIANQADELVAHNGDNFDLPFFATRCALHGIVFPTYKTADTLQWARRKFMFNSNKLDYLAQFFGVGKKLHTNFDLWKDICLKQCPKALAKMSRYCKPDVVVLEKVWKKIVLLSPVKSHAGVLNNGGKWTCPHCASEAVKINMTRVTAAGTKQYQMKCKCCGKIYTISGSSMEAYKEAKKNDTDNAK